MRKKFKTLDEQIDVLKSRGLKIPDEKRAKEYLLSNNYYNIINGYSKPFMLEKEKYISTATFDEICKLYFFDKELKQILFNAILDAEKHLKSIFTYYFAQEHQNQRAPYLDINSYNHAYSLEVAYLISKLDRLIKQNKKYENNAISYYYKKYDDVPIWVLVDYIDFGTLITLIKCVPDKVQNKIAKELTSFIKKNNPEFSNHFPAQMMLSFIKNIHEIRNLCAHNKRLIYFNCRADSKYYKPIHSKYDISKNDIRTSTFVTFINLQCFISDHEYATLHNAIRKRMITLDKQINSIPIELILASLGFPKDWHKSPKLYPQKSVDNIKD
ncbi:Abi family protein [Lactobacillus mulieris]|uniref:Abi family protein n=1 Tax=Lactobacillus mulieris TaxID=2508708 RepID=UPI001432987B|nr:Abi family protein [Lactobacillus mulieris]MCF1784313.1 Abi family protein [Lactobacillus mulieris]MCW8104388.1 Abi family protein [Lactobacillus mulieris]MDK6803203.1 Abi family protein [Lactobacillus mulieris]MDK8382319.1 Abi family protein [Lactobacillus mulieris]MDT9620548.1 Abi family protein [Lactobacillus mulieris]